MTRLRTTAACDKSAAEQFAPYSVEAEARAVDAWKAVERFTRLAPDELRQQMGALIEIGDFIDRAMDAVMPEREDA